MLHEEAVGSLLLAIVDQLQILLTEKLIQKRSLTIFWDKRSDQLRGREERQRERKIERETERGKLSGIFSSKVLERSNLL
jgi:hypothetical protein